MTNSGGRQPRREDKATKVPPFLWQRTRIKIIIKTKRIGPMPHNGYRPFDIKNTFNSFPSFKYTLFDKAILEIIQK